MDPKVIKQLRDEKKAARAAAKAPATPEPVEPEKIDPDEVALKAAKLTNQLRKLATQTPLTTKQVTPEMLVERQAQAAAEAEQKRVQDLAKKEGKIATLKTEINTLTQQLKALQAMDTSLASTRTRVSKKQGELNRATDLLESLEDPQAYQQRQRTELEDAIRRAQTALKDANNANLPPKEIKTKERTLQGLKRDWKALEPRTPSPGKPIASPAPSPYAKLEAKLAVARQEAHAAQQALDDAKANDNPIVARLTKKATRAQNTVTACTTALDKAMARDARTEQRHTDKLAKQEEKAKAKADAKVAAADAKKPEQPTADAPARPVARVVTKLRHALTTFATINATPADPTIVLAAPAPTPHALATKPAAEDTTPPNDDPNGFAARKRAEGQARAAEAHAEKLAKANAKAAAEAAAAAKKAAAAEVELQEILAAMKKAQAKAAEENPEPAEPTLAERIAINQAAAARRKSERSNNWVEAVSLPQAGREPSPEGQANIAAWTKAAAERGAASRAKTPRSK